MLALGDAEDDFDIGLIEGRAELLDRPTAEVIDAARLEKYADQLGALGLTAADYASTYSQVIRITPRDFLGLARSVDAAQRPGRRGARRLDRRAATARASPAEPASRWPSAAEGCRRRGSSSRFGFRRRSGDGSACHSAAGCAA